MLNEHQLGVKSILVLVLKCLRPREPQNEISRNLVLPHVVHASKSAIDLGRLGVCSQPHLLVFLVPLPLSI